MENNLKGEEGMKKDDQFTSRVFKEIVNKKDRWENQRVMWDDLKKKINHLVNKINDSNLIDVSLELLSLNLLWGRGLFCNAVLNSFLSSSSSTTRTVSSVSVSTVASMITVVNAKFPDVGYLLLKRAVIRFVNSIENRNEIELISIVKLLAFLINLGVVKKKLGLEMMCKITQVGIKGNIGLCQMIIKESNLRLSDDFFTNDWDFVNLFDDQVTHEISILHELDEEMELNVFRPDTNFTNDDL